MASPDGIVKGLARPTSPTRIGVVGIGKIARDQHLPAIAASPDFVLTAVASRHAGVDDVPSFSSIDELLAHGPEVDAISICTPPDGRDAIAARAIAAGKHVMIEKPPGATVSEVEALISQARTAGVAFHATWHSREAAAVTAARDWLHPRTIHSVAIAWRENIRKWHPGQDWILAAGGFGVFDPGINALSIATAILPGRLAVRRARLMVPANRQSPIAADIAMTLAGNVPVNMALDFLQTEGETWEIVVDSDDGQLALTSGGGELAIDGTLVPLPAHRGEYPQLYAAFAGLIADRRIDADLTPLQLVADAFLLAERETVAAFDF
jgi:D-galactose 1-dehydrogenase/L-arabinose 1- dehydrogenase